MSNNILDQWIKWKFENKRAYNWLINIAMFEGALAAILIITLLYQFL